MNAIKLLNRSFYSSLARFQLAEPLTKRLQYGFEGVERAVEDKFGTAVNPLTRQKEQIRRFTLTNRNKITLQVTNFGATITALKLPDANGRIDDVILGFDSATGYEASQNPFTALNNGHISNQLTRKRLQYRKRENLYRKQNAIPGFIGFDRLHWKVLHTSNSSVLMQHKTPDDHKGYPGKVRATVQFTLTDDNCLKVFTEATTTKVTALNFTNHRYFNLAGHHTGRNGLYEHYLMINADKVTKNDENGTPTGVMRPVEGSLYDFRRLNNLGRRIKKMQSSSAEDGYDDNYCANLVLKRYGLTKVASAIHPKTGRWMEVFSDEPGIHFYSGQYMGATGPILGKNGAKYGKHGAFCLNTQKYHDNFQSIVLCPESKYTHEVVYKFGVLGSTQLSK